MSTSSCYDDSPTDFSEKSSVTEMQELNDDKNIIITKMKVVARRHETWHEKFLSYDEILKYIAKLEDTYKKKFSVECLGHSREHRPILLIRISSSKLKRSSMSVMIEAGANGTEKMTVSCALYLIDNLVKNRRTFLVDYLIVPCLNPDAYEKCCQLKRLTKYDQKYIDLTKSFPISRNVQSTTSSTKKYDSTAEVNPNCMLLMKALEKNLMSVKLFISLQASESSLTYPLDHYFKEVFEFALASKKSMGWDALDVKPIVPTLTENTGTSVEHVIRNHHRFVKFAYILNVHNKSFVPDEKFIFAKGDQTLCGILTLSKRVYRYYSTNRCNYSVKTVVKLLGSTTE